jgi:hypothetical protein
MEDNNFDKKVAEYLSHRKMEVSQDAWQKLATELPLQPKSNPKYWIASAAAVLVLGLVWVFKQDTEKVPITVVEPSSEINLNTTHPVLTGEVKHIESVDNTKTSTNNIPIAKLAEKQVNLNQIKSVTKAENLPILNENPTHDLILTEVSKSTDNNEFKENISKEASLTDLVLSNLENQKTQYKIDPDELLKIVESEIEKEKDKRFRDKVIDKVKSTMTDLNIAIK